MKRAPKSNAEWLWWGQTDPLYGVCSVLGKSRSNREPWTEEAFYATAVEEFATNLRHWKQYGLVAESCVEIGCGAFFDGGSVECFLGPGFAIAATLAENR